MNKKKLIVSLSIIGIVAAIAIGGTIAYFSDTESSIGNKFVAGKFNLKIDNTCHYNGKVCAYYDSDNGFIPGYYWDGDPTQEPCFCTWEEKDLDGELYFNLLDVKPGDNGEDTISLHVDNNSAWICAEVANLVNQDNDCESPENKVDTTCGNPGIGEGELQNNLFFTVWKDTNCDNILDIGEQVLVQNQPAQAGIWPIADSQHGPAISGGATICYGVKWNVPIETTNIIQTDSLVGNVIFTAVQSRNMDTFKCSDLTPTNCTPTAETCNGLDDDCDGQVDEGCGCTTNAECNDGLYCNGIEICNAQGICESPGNPCPGHDVGPACNDSCSETNDNCTANDLDETTCTGGSCQSGACVAVCVPTTEICDGIDNDCDQAIDEDDPQLGTPCDGPDSDLCNEGTRSCSGGVLVCSDNTGGSVDVCDGVDNDCDSASADGSEDPQNGMACDGADADLCAEGTRYCSAGSLNCSDSTGDTAEICGDAVDNDCDGTVDEGCVAPECTVNANCVDGNPCTTDSCSAGTCLYNPITGSMPISMESIQFCTFGGTCNAGILQGCYSFENCNDSNPCTIDGGAYPSSCTHTPKDCSDGNVFTYDYCDQSGTCVNYLPPIDVGFHICFPLWGGGQTCFP